MQLVLPGFQRPMQNAGVLGIVSAGICVPDGYASETSDYATDGASIQRARGILSDLGIEVLGDGAYSIVIPHEEDDKVIKITLSEVDGYHAFVEYVLGEGQNLDDELRQHLPVIHSSEVFDGVRVTVLERLAKRGWDAPSFHDCPTTWTLCGVLGGEMPETCVDDISSSNVMKREDGTNVVTDPWSHKSW